MCFSTIFREKKALWNNKVNPDNTMVRMKNLFQHKLEIRINEADTNLHFSLRWWAMAASASALPLCLVSPMRRFSPRFLVLGTGPQRVLHYSNSARGMDYFPCESASCSLLRLRLEVIIKGSRHSLTLTAPPSSDVSLFVSLCWSCSRNSLNFTWTRPDANLCWHLLINVEMHFDFRGG